MASFDSCKALVDSLIREITPYFAAISYDNDIEINFSGPITIKAIEPMIGLKPNQMTINIPEGIRYFIPIINAIFSRNFGIEIKQKIRNERKKIIEYQVTVEGHQASIFISLSSEFDRNIKYTDFCGCGITLLHIRNSEARMIVKNPPRLLLSGGYPLPEFNIFKLLKEFGAVGDNDFFLKKEIFNISKKLSLKYGDIKIRENVNTPVVVLTEDPIYMAVTPCIVNAECGHCIGVKPYLEMKEKHEGTVKCPHCRINMKLLLCNQNGCIHSTYKPVVKEFLNIQPEQVSYFTLENYKKL